MPGRRRLDRDPVGDRVLGGALHPDARAAFYLIQDFEPMFYPAGSLYALTEETYRLGLYGLCNTERLRDIYPTATAGRLRVHAGGADRRVPRGRPAAARARRTDPACSSTPGPATGGTAGSSPARPSTSVKRRFGQDVDIVTAGSWARPEDLGRGIEHRGLLDYRDTGALYRTCDVGVALTAVGAPVVPAARAPGLRRRPWSPSTTRPATGCSRHEENCVRTPRTVDGLAEGISRLVADVDLRERLSARGLEDIAARHADWPGALERHLRLPLRSGGGAPWLSGPSTRPGTTSRAPRAAPSASCSERDGDGVVLDLGCGYGHVSEPIRDLGLTYVGLDIDREALTDLEQRGFEVGTLDLQVSRPPSWRLDWTTRWASGPSPWC